MEVLDKLKILADAAKYDVSCSSSGGSRRNDGKGLGNSAAAPMGICHSWAADGRCISLLKLLFSNVCIHDCAYCINRRSNDIPRASFTVDELIDLTINFYRRNYIEGLFLSSGILKSPDYTTELLLSAIKRLRLEQRFNGYIHLKVIPGASRELIREAGLYADRLSINIELPSEQGLKALAPQKRRDDILTPMAYIGTKIQANAEERKLYRKALPFVPAGQSTQLIVGASPEPDSQILQLSEQLYRRVNLRRVYYSAYVPVNSNPLLPALTAPPLQREHRLYQADWLIRFYKFRAAEIAGPQQPFLDPELDPKTGWALRNLHLFPVEVNRVDYETLLRIPGVGLKSAERLVAARRFGPLGFGDLQKMGVVMKRARYFITCQGRYLEKTDNDAWIRQRLLAAEPSGRPGRSGPATLQIPLFSEI
ncbi:putative DNA modification/repair radical SAM protein [Hydrogenispora ethanolica]|uniref:Putative DNA modification/repair radical SAM protein n=1 Tax=Hydrogenispora ethanolica TaxID=1082276 RepID=A0A4R1R325_HYDET|nr:putative DNA modification/repair radical SAM protein [Hydrogenispora ethanolica]TCL59800.1 putative DNA modification/repair radical SAM protein [Hydrogenispora ethanolica]